MSSVVVAITNKGIIVADSLTAAQNVAANSGQIISSTISRAAEGGAPVVEGAADSLTLLHLIEGASHGPDAYVRESFAAMVGTIAATIALPLGPYASVITEMAVSEAYKEAYDAATAWSRNLDWSAVWDFIDYLLEPAKGYPTPVTVIDPADYINRGLLDPHTLLPTNSPQPIPTISPKVNVNWQQAVTPPRRDPLAIDLDGDGIETVGIPGSGNPILFDHDGDGVRTGTGWLKPDDAWLVLDQNGNGVIDSGRELFGVDTLINVTDTFYLPGGGTMTQTVTRNARSGFEALTALDGNHDGVFDVRDAAFGQVRLWQDTNQDGVSQIAEMSSLASKGIVSISLTPTATATPLGNGNTVTGQATVTRSSGSTTLIDSVDLQASNLTLASNPFYRQFSDHIPLTAAATGLPDMGGSGWVRDMREAASLTNTGGQQLAGALTTFKAATTRSQQLAQLDSVVDAWARSTGRVIGSSLIPMAGTVISSDATQQTTHYTAYDPANTPDPSSMLIPCVSLALPSVYYDNYGTTLARMNAGGLDVMRRLGDLEAFNGTRFVDFNVTQAVGGSVGLGSGGGGGGSGGVAQTTGFQTRWLINLAQQQVDSINAAYEELGKSVYSALFVQTRMEPYLGAIAMSIDMTGFHPDTSPLAAKLEGLKSIDPKNGFADLIDLNRFGSHTLVAAGYDGMSQLRSWLQQLPASSPVQVDIAAMGVLAAGTLNGTSKDDIFFGDDAVTTFNAGAGDDLVDVGGGDDVVNGQDGNDYLWGRAGSDRLDGGAGNDTLDGGVGNDTLTGGAGNNSYLFGKGDGQDLIQYSYDTTVGRLSTVQLRAGVSPSEVVLKQVYDNVFGGATGALEISIAGTTDKITVNSFFYGDDPTNAYNGVQQIQFADGTTWDIAAIKAKLYAGTSGNDNIRGSVGADTLTGGSGDDTLNGAAGDDTIDGGAGNDVLYGDVGNDVITGAAGNDTFDGGAGNDSLDGGAGNDTLTGGTGNNTYLFGKGDGQDLIQYSWDTTAGKLSTVQMKAGVAPSEVLLKQVADTTFGGTNGALEISIAGTTDKITVNSFFYGDDTGNGYNGVQQIRFADGTIWSMAAIKAKLYAGTAGNDNIRGSTVADTLTGGAGDDTLNGAAGDDTIDGGVGNDVLWGDVGNDVLTGAAGNDSLDGAAGNDSLDGGAGNDTLTGGAGNNTYLFGKGDGQDLIQYSYDPSATKLSTVQFKSGVAASEVLLKQVADTTLGGYALELSIAGTTDKVTINGFFSVDDPANPYNGVQQVRFTDGTTWDLATIRAKLYAGTAGNDTLRGTIAAETITGGGGDDSLNGAAGDDTVDGGIGNDVLYGDIGNDAVIGGAGNDSLDGGVGDDSLDGGAGNDTLTGGTGNNTYLFGKGDGQDLIQYGYDATAGKLSTVQLKAGVLPTEVVLKQVYDNAMGGANGALEVSIAGTTDKVTINGFFYGDDPGGNYNGVQQIKFADGTVWSIATIKSKLYAGTAANDNIRGSTAADSITGGGGDDTLNGAAGDDVVDGGIGNDVLYGDAGNDSLKGSDGNDSLDGGAGNDTLDGGLGNDTLTGGAGNNTYLFGKGDGQDLVQYSYDSTAGKLSMVQLKAGVAPAEIALKQVYDSTLGGAAGALEIAITGTTDKVTINGFFYANDPGNPYNGVQQLKFSDGTVWDMTTILSKIGLGTAGNDNISGTAGSDLLNGGAGDDTIHGNDGNDSVYGGDGIDALFGDNGNDSLGGGLGADTLDGGAGDDTLDGGAGNDTLTGGVGNNTYLFGKGDGQDLIQYSYDAAVGKLSTVQLKTGVAPSEVVLKQVYDSVFGGSNGALELSIAGTTDKVTINSFFYGDDPSNPYNGVQQIRFADGTIWSIAAIKANLYAGTAGNDNLRGSIAADTITGGGGDDSINAAPGDDTIDGGTGNDTLYGDAGNDSIKGGDGNDVLDGGAGNDAIEGGLGNDTLTGGVGNNSYSFGKGDGQDVILYSYDTTAGKLSTVQFKSGVLPSEIVLKQVYDTTFGGSNGALEISIAGTTDKITVNSFFYGDDPSNAYNGVQQIQFADGTTWDIAAIKAKLYAGTSGNDNIRGSVGADTLTGGSGDDTLNGAAGDDTIDGGAGNDVLYGDVGNDVITGAAGNDTFDGGAGNDSLDGGAGNDTLTGGTGNNTYLFGKGDGQDLIQYSWDTTAGKLSTVQMKAGVAPSEVLLKQVADTTFGGTNGALEISIAGTTDKITVNSFFYGDDTGNGYNGVQQIRFADGTIWSMAAIKAKLYAGTAGNDALRGTIAAETITGGGGDDSLNGAGGDDTVDGGAGNDVLYGDVGNDAVIGGAGNDTLDGGAGNDTLDGGAGTDMLTGGVGNNIYLFGKGDGQDLIQYGYDATAGRLSTVQLKAGVAPSEVALKQVYDNAMGGANGALEVSITGTTDKVTINGFFYGDDPGGSYSGVQQIKFADGTVWDIAAIKAKTYAGTAGNDNLRGSTVADTISGDGGDDSINAAAGDDTVDGGTGNDVLYGDAGNDSLKGSDGNDSLDGGAGNDTLDGGLGNDTLTGGAGNNTYLFGKGDGQDLVQYSYDSTAGKLSMVQLKAGVVPSEVVLKQVYDNVLGGSNGALELSIAGTTDKVTINGFFYGDDPTNPYNGVQQIKFSDGTIWDIAAIKAKIYTGTAGNDTLRGSTVADTISGGGGDDSINAAGGDDTVDGGTGNDVLYGDLGNDSLKGGDGNDSLDGGAGNDTLEGGLGNDTSTGGAGNNTYLFGKGDGQDLIQYSYDSTAGKLSTVQLKAGVLPTEVALRQVYDNVLGGSNGALELSIAGTTDKVNVNGFFYSDDPTNPYNGVQQIKFADGTVWDIAAIKAKIYAGTAGNDSLRGSTVADTISGGGGDDSINGAAGDDTVDGGVGNDVLYGDIGNDTVIGGAGNDTLDGGVGNDSLDGGAGNDTLTGGTGNNTYLFGKGDGQDLIQYGYDATAGRLSTVQLKAGVVPSEVVLKQVYDNAFGGSNGALELSIAGTTDKVTINAFFYGDDPAGNYNGVQQIKFADGTLWDIAAIKAKLYGGTAGNDNMRGTTAADVLAGGAGDDNLNGAAGNDSIDGGVGNDTLYGDVGNDSLIGGAGNDSLNGGAGNDTYSFGRGAGADVISEYDSLAGNTDVLSFAAGVTADQVWFRQLGSDLEVSIIGTADKALIQGWYYGSPYHVEQFKTADGKTLLDSKVQDLVSAMAGFTPPALGQTTLPDSYKAVILPVVASDWGP